MYTDTKGVVFRQIKTVNGRRMVLLFSEKFGKISAGTGINEKGRGKSALAMRPFTCGRYELYKTRNNCNINSAEVIKSFYGIGEDVEKYMFCSYVLEFTEKLLPEEAPAPLIFQLLLDYFDVMVRRKKKYLTLILAYQIKALQYAGSMPEMRKCVLCGAKDDLCALHVKEGGLVCGCCLRKTESGANETLIFTVNFGIVDVFRYFMNNPFKSFEHLALDEELLAKLNSIVKNYVDYHLDIRGLKSESFLIE